MVQAFEAGPATGAPWTAEDRALATRLARETTPADASARALPGRARAPRAAHAGAARQGGGALAGPAPVAPGAGCCWRCCWVAALGLAVDAVGGSQRINLLAPPVWAVIAWNLARLPEPAAAGSGGAQTCPRLAWRVGLARVPGGSAPLQACGQAWARHGCAAGGGAGGAAAAPGRRGARPRPDGGALPARPGARLPRRLAKHLPRRRHGAGRAGHAAGPRGGADRHRGARRRRAGGAARAARTRAATAAAAPWIHLYAAMLVLCVVAAAAGAGGVGGRARALAVAPRVAAARRPLFPAPAARTPRRHAPRAGAAARCRADAAGGAGPARTAGAGARARRCS